MPAGSLRFQKPIKISKKSWQVLHYKLMKTFYFLILLGVNFSIFGQVNSQPKFHFGEDSIAYFKKKSLKDNGITHIMTFYRHYSGGRLPMPNYYYMIWLDSVDGHICFVGNASIRDTTATFVKEIFNFYKFNRIDTITTEIKLSNSLIHDFGYYVTIDVDSTTTKFRIKDYQRGVGQSIENSNISKKELFLLKNDLRIKLFNMFENIRVLMD